MAHPPLREHDVQSLGGAGLLIIDVQCGFDDPSWGRRNNPDAEQNIASLLDAWRTNGGAIFHVRHDSIEWLSTLNPGHPGNRIKPEAAPVAGELVYAKVVNSAFTGTELEADLRADGVSALVIVGLTTNHCVSTTARMAANLGFQTLVVADATATFERLGLDGTMREADAVHLGALSDLAGEFATIVTTDEVLESVRAPAPL